MAATEASAPIPGHCFPTSKLSAQPNSAQFIVRPSAHAERHAQYPGIFPSSSSVSCSMLGIRAKAVLVTKQFGAAKTRADVGAAQ